jgi:hypothetical protein
MGGPLNGTGIVALEPGGTTMPRVAALLISRPPCAYASRKRRTVSRPGIGQHGQIAAMDRSNGKARRGATPAGLAVGASYAGRSNRPDNHCPHILNGQ